MDDNGCIYLTNNSTGAGYEPVDMTSLFFEGFEDECKISILESDEVTWKIEENPENGANFIDKPVAYEGMKCLQLSANDLSGNASGVFEFSCTPQNQTGKLRLKFHYTSMHLRFSTPNIIKIEYRTNDESDWNMIEVKSSENNKWQQTAVDFSANKQVQFRIEGVAYAGSILAIDNITVEQEAFNEEQCIEDMGLQRNIPSISCIYSLDGRKRK